MNLDQVLDGFNYVCSIVNTILMVLMLVSYRKPKKFKISDQFLSILLTLVTLPVYMWISGARLNILIAVGLIILGGVYGVIRGLTVKMYYVDDEIIGRNSMLSLAAYCGSLVISNIMNTFDSTLLASLGLAPLCVSTGIQFALNGTLILRKLLMRRPQARRTS
ncbi:MAG TPA: hypothetical protein VJ965_11090 [Anaerolineales bacterium]|nr:hypothetical protein [Anaerolineales bacterium]